MQKMYPILGMQKRCAKLGKQKTMTNTRYAENNYQYSVSIKKFSILGKLKKFSILGKWKKFSILDKQKDF